MSQLLDISDITVVIPVFNQLHFTQSCVESLNRAGISDAQIIIVNNASSDGTVEFLATRPNLRVINNEQNRGCGGAWTQGAEAAVAAGAIWTVVLNNDVLVPAGFFEGLKQFALEEKMDVVSPAMCEGENDYDWQSYAAEFVGKMKGVRRDRVAHGVCFMVHRRVFEAIGYFDGDMQIGGYEDDEFFRRVMRAGFRLSTTGSAFLHHFGSVTQKAMNLKQVAARTYYRKKNGQTWLKRKLPQMRNNLRNRWWRSAEKKRFGHTLKERRRGGVWEYH